MDQRGQPIGSIRGEAGGVGGYLVSAGAIRKRTRRMSAGFSHMYREVIEHPASLPPEIKRHLDLTSGRDRGRLYRIAPTGWKPRPVPQLSHAKTAELAALLDI